MAVRPDADALSWLARDDTSDDLCPVIPGANHKPAGRRPSVDSRPPDRRRLTLGNQNHHRHGQRQLVFHEDRGKHDKDALHNAHSPLLDESPERARKFEQDGPWRAEFIQALSAASSASTGSLDVLSAAERSVLEGSLDLKSKFEKAGGSKKVTWTYRLATCEVLHDAEDGGVELDSPTATLCKCVTTLRASAEEVLSSLWCAGSPVRYAPCTKLTVAKRPSCRQASLRALHYYSVSESPVVFDINCVWARLSPDAAQGQSGSPTKLYAIGLVSTAPPSDTPLTRLERQRRRASWVPDENNDAAAAAAAHVEAAAERRAIAEADVRVVPCDEDSDADGERSKRRDVFERQRSGARPASSSAAARYSGLMLISSAGGVRRSELTYYFFLDFGRLFEPLRSFFPNLRRSSIREHRRLLVSLNAFHLNNTHKAVPIQTTMSADVLRVGALLRDVRARARKEKRSLASPIECDRQSRELMSLLAAETQEALAPHAFVVPMVGAVLGEPSRGTEACPVVATPMASLSDSEARLIGAALSRLLRQSNTDAKKAVDTWMLEYPAVQQLVHALPWALVLLELIGAELKREPPPKSRLCVVL